MAGYPLSSVERAREELEREAAARLARAEAEHAQAREARTEAARRLARHRERSEGTGPGRCTGAELRLHAEAMERGRALEAELRGALAAALVVERSADAEVARSRRALADAAVDRRLIERHHEGWERSRARAAEARADDELDELAARRS